MSKYNTFLTFFIISLVAGIIFFISYVKIISTIVIHSNEYFNDHFNNDPFEMFRNIFTSAIIISFCVMIASSLTAKIIGIVYVAKNKLVTGGEKALWIVGFVIFGFITAIVFLILAKNKKFVE